ncbi:MAG: hypothetical protein H7X80_11355 [bacterium]|nr:hypothetical protein [Candidatus Kapabacteria bacterium]
MQKIESIDSAQKTFRFTTGNATIDNLKAGDVVIFGDYTFRKVRSVSSFGNIKTVQTDSCAITDAIKNCNINWDYGVRFDPNVIKRHPKFGKRSAVTAADTFGVQLEKGDYEYAVGIKLLTDRMNVNVRALKKLAGSKVAELRADAVIYKSRALGKILIENGKLMEFEARNDFAAGDVTLELAAAGSGRDIGIEVEIPMLVLPIPQMPVFTFEVKTLIVINANVPGDGSSLIKARFKYDVDGGFKYVNGTSVRSIAQLRGDEVTKQNEPRTGASSGVAISWGLALPKLELKFLDTPIGWVQTAYLIGGDYTPAFPACQRAKAQFIGAAGYGIGAFGFTLASGSTTLWQKEYVFLKTAQCP